MGRKGTYNVKFLAENYTKKNVPNTRVLATERQAGTFADGQRMLLQCMQPTADGESSMEIQRTSAIGSLSSACGRYMEYLLSGRLLAHNSVLPQADEAVSLALSYLCLPFRTCEACLSEIGSLVPVQIFLIVEHIAYLILGVV